MDRLGAVKRGERDDDPDLGQRALGVQGAGAVPAHRRRRPSTLPDRSPEVATDNPVFVPPFLGSKVVKGVAHRRHRRLHQRDGAVPQPVAVPAREGRRRRGEDDDEFKDRIRPILRDELAKAKAGRHARAPGRLRLLPRQRRRQRPRRSGTTSPAPPSDAVRLPPPAQGAVPLHRRLLPADRVGRGRLRGVPHRHDGAARSASSRPSCSPRTGTRSTCCCTASASRWPRRSPSSGTAASARSGASPTRTARRLAGLFRQQYRGGRYSWGYPACPDLEDNVKVAELLDAERIGIECSEETGCQYQPEQTTSALICHHPRAKYFVAR